MSDESRDLEANHKHTVGKSCLYFDNKSLMEVRDLPIDHENAYEEEEDFLAGGDLGDGLGRRPGGVYDSTAVLTAHVLKTRKASDTKGPSSVFSCKKPEDNGKPNSFVDILSKRHGTDGMRCSRENSSDANSEMSNEELRQRLQELSEEVDILRTELEAAQRQIEGKDEALRIMQSMAMFDKATSHTKANFQKTEEERRALEKEINSLQWEVEFEHNRMKNLEESWKEKYERIHCENMVLKETLELRTNEVKILKSENTILNQQCLEILAMLDVKQQEIFQENMSSDKSGLTEVTALELAVLGACSCGGEEPCACAKMSAATRKQLLHFKQEYESEKKNKEEAYIMADAFRIAFEQQLKRRNDQAITLRDVDKTCRKETRQLNNWKRIKEDGILFAKGNAEHLGKKLMGMLISVADYRKLEKLDDTQEIIKILIDLLNDKEEALAHQRKVSYMLSRVMEEKVKDETPSKETGTSGDGSSVQNHQSGNPDSKEPTAITCCCLHKAAIGNSFCKMQSTNVFKKPLRTLKKSNSLPSRYIFCSEWDYPEKVQINMGKETKENSKQVAPCGVKTDKKLDF